MAALLNVTIALSDRVEANDIALALAEEHGISAVLWSATEIVEDSDVILTDGQIFDRAVPHLGLGNVADAPNLKGRLPAHAEVELIAAAIRVVAAGFRLSNDVDAPRTPLEPEDSDSSPAGYRLTPRELEVLALLADGASNKLIARELDISVHTAKFHVAALLSKLHARNRTDAIGIAMREGLLLL